MKKTLKAIVAACGIFAIASSAYAATLSNPLITGGNFPNIGSSSTVSGSCGTVGANGNVSFYITQNGQVTNLANTNNLSTNSSGSFSGNVTYPSSAVSGNAVLTAQCPNGDIINSPTLIFAASPSTSFNLTSSPNAAGLFQLSGACGGSNGEGSATLRLSNSSTSVNLSNVNLNAQGQFTSNVVIPSSFPSGPATITATCSNGTTFSSNVNVNPAAVSNFAITGAPEVGGIVAASGNCGTTSGNVSFRLMNVNGTTNIPATRNASDTSGNFNASIGIPANFPTGQATLVVACPNGNTFTSPITVTAMTIDDSTDVTDDEDCCPEEDVGGTSETPEGAVAAGGVQQTASSASILLTGFVALSYFLGRKYFVNDKTSSKDPFDSYTP